MKFAARPAAATRHTIDCCTLLLGFNHPKGNFPALLSSNETLLQPAASRPADRSPDRPTARPPTADDGTTRYEGQWKKRAPPHLIPALYLEMSGCHCSPLSSLVGREVWRSTKKLFFDWHGKKIHELLMAGESRIAFTLSSVSETKSPSN